MGNSFITVKSVTPQNCILNSVRFGNATRGAIVVIFILDSKLSDSSPFILTIFENTASVTFAELRFNLVKLAPKFGTLSSVTLAPIKYT